MQLQIAAEKRCFMIHQVAAMNCDAAFYQIDLVRCQ